MHSKQHMPCFFLVLFCIYVDDAISLFRLFLSDYNNFFIHLKTFGKVTKNTHRLPYIFQHIVYKSIRYAQQQLQLQQQ